MKKFYKLGLCLVVFWACGQSAPAHAQTDVLSSIQQRVERFQQRYGIPLVYQGTPPQTQNRITFAAVTPQEYSRLDQYLSLFEEEINKYPPSFFKGRDVRAIGIVTRLFSQETPAQGIYSSDARVMFFDFLRFSDNKSLQKHSIHHELFHMMALQTQGYQLNDGEWSALNAEGFVYGEQKRTWKEVNPYNQGAPYLAGFVTDYAMMSVEEDKAEVFACLMQKAHKRLITQWSQKDALMRQKIQSIKDFVEVYSPEMNESYWNL